jgi:hypothetical protein
MRAEQRTRLDSGTKFIQYYAAIAAAGGAALVAASKDYANVIWDFRGFFGFLFCGVTVLVAFAQYYEELFVLRIGSYLEKGLKANISQSDDHRYWNWDDFHYRESKYPFLSKLAGFIRFGFLPLIAALGFGYAVSVWKCSCPPSFLHRYPLVSWTLFWVDSILWIAVVFTGISLSGKRLGKK